MNSRPRIPVIMYHSVGLPSRDWKWRNLTVDVGLFEKQVALLKSKGYRSIDLDAFRARQEDRTSRPGRDLLFTFDDGYMDNWVFAFPILKREGMVGAIYVNPDFIDPGEEPRPNLEDVWAGRVAMGDLEVHGFLNRGELRKMQGSGVMTIASHSMTHTWYPAAPEIVDFHRPGLDTPWLAWNKAPERKHAYLTEDQSGLTPWGHPIYRHGRSLGIRRFHPEPDAARAAEEWVAANGGAAAFDMPDWEARLKEVVAPHETRGRMETDEEQDARYRHEIFRSREILAEITGAPVNHFCWPGGEYNDTSWALAEEAGFHTICVTEKDAVRWREEDPRLVRRIGCRGNFPFFGGRYYTRDPHFLLLTCEMARGVKWKKWPYRWRKLVGATRAGFRPFNRKMR